MKALSDSEFRKYHDLIYAQVGINLGDHKRTLVQSRLRKWLVELNLSTYGELYDRIVEDRSGQMLTMLVNAITTNVTSFFREESQWIYLKEHLDELVDRKHRKLRIWSAACSSGQEPYSILLFLLENLDNFKSWDIKILATDISDEILRKAIDGIYPEKEVESMPRHMLANYFDTLKLPDGKKEYQLRRELRDYVLFRSFNLVTGDFSIFHNRFDLIFCRNVMIYFDRPTQNGVLMHFSTLMHERSRLFIGHSESVQIKDGPYRLVAPSIYRLA